MEQQKLRYYALHKPFGYLSQFSDEGNNPGLGQLLDLPKDVYPVGRLDKDSEGLLLLTNDKSINQRLLSPAHKHKRVYWVQVEHDITKEAIQKLRFGVTIKVGKKSYRTLPAQVEKIQSPKDLPERVPPVRFRKNIPTSWVRIELTEGKNRQVRKMCAQTDFPCLRLIRVSIEGIKLRKLQPGKVQEIQQPEFYRLLHLT